MTKWNDIRIFRKVGQIGLPYALPAFKKEHLRATFHMFNTKDGAGFFKPGGREKLIEEGAPEKLRNQMLQNTVDNFQSKLDSAAFVFGHSILDGAALDYCRVCALFEPEDWHQFVGKKQVSFEDVKTLTYSELLKREVDNNLNWLERQSLIYKIDRLFAICRLPDKFEPVKNYKYDRSRILQLDELRHEVVHATKPALPETFDAELEYLEKTTYFLMSLVASRYGLKDDTATIERAFSELGAE